MYLVSDVSTPCLLSSRGKPSFAGSPTVVGDGGGRKGRGGGGGRGKAGKDRSAAWDARPARRFPRRLGASARRRCRRDNGAARIGGGMHAAAAAAAAPAPLLSSRWAGVVRGGARARVTRPTTRSRLSRRNSGGGSTHEERAARGASARLSSATVRRIDDGDGGGEDDDDGGDDAGRRTRMWQRLSNRPRGLSCPGSPALLRPSSSYRDHSSHFHVPKSRSRRPSPLGKRRNVRISASPDVDSVAAAADAGKPDNAFSRALWSARRARRARRYRRPQAPFFPAAAGHAIRKFPSAPWERVAVDSPPPYRFISIIIGRERNGFVQRLPILYYGWFLHLDPTRSWKPIVLKSH